MDCGTWKHRMTPGRKHLHSGCLRETAAYIDRTLGHVWHRMPALLWKVETWEDIFKNNSWVFNEFLAQELFLIVFCVNSHLKIILRSTSDIVFLKLLTKVCKTVITSHTSQVGWSHEEGGGTTIIWIPAGIVSRNNKFFPLFSKIKSNYSQTYLYCRGQLV